MCKKNITHQMCAIILLRDLKLLYKIFCKAKQIVQKMVSARKFKEQLISFKGKYPRNCCYYFERSCVGVWVCDFNVGPKNVRWFIMACGVDFVCDKYAFKLITLRSWIIGGESTRDICCLAGMQQSQQHSPNTATVKYWKLRHAIMY